LVQNHQLRSQISEYKEKIVKKSGKLTTQILDSKQDKHYPKCKQILLVSRSYAPSNTSIYELYIRLQLTLGQDVAHDVKELVELLHSKNEVDEQYKAVNLVIKLVPEESLERFLDEIMREFNFSQNYIKHLTVLSSVLNDLGSKLVAKVIMELADHQVDDSERASMMFNAIAKDPENETIFNRAQNWFRESNRISDLIMLSFGKIRTQPSTMVDNMQMMVLAMSEAMEKQKRDFELHIANLRKTQYPTPRQAPSQKAESNEEQSNQILDLQDQCDRMQQEIVQQQEKVVDEATTLRERLEFIERTALPMHKHYEYHCKKYMRDLKKQTLRMVQPPTKCRSIIPTGDAIYCVISLKGSLVATSHPNKNEIQVWDINDAQPVKTIGRQVSDMKSIWEMCTAGNSRLITASLAVGGLKVFNWRQGNLINTVVYHVAIAGAGHPGLLAFGPSHQYCAVAMQVCSIHQMI
jgi:TolA-binding protein